MVIVDMYSAGVVVVDQNQTDRDYSAAVVDMRKTRYRRSCADAAAAAAVGSKNSERGPVRRMIGSQRGRAIEAHRSLQSRP